MSAETDLQDVRKALSEGRSVKYGSRTYSLREIRDELIPLLEKAAEREAGTARAVQQRPQQLGNLSARDKKTTKQAIGVATDKLKEANRLRDAAERLWSRNEISEQDYRDAIAVRDAVQADIDALQSGTAIGRTTETGYEVIPFSESALATTQRANIGGTEVRAGAAAPMATPTREAPRSSTSIDNQIARLGQVTGITTTTATTPQPEGGAGGAGTGGGIGGVVGGKGKEGKRKTPPAPPVASNWEELVRKNYNQYAWMLDEIDRTKYADVFDLLARVVTPNSGITEDNFDAQFQSTSWYKELATAQVGRRVTAAVGALSFDSGNYARFLNKALNMGWEGENLKAEAYKEAFRKNDDGTYANSMAATEVRKSNAFLSIKKIGAQFLSPLSDQRAEEVLTGGLTTSDVQRVARETAKVNYPHLAAAIDAGVTLEDLTADYRYTAANTLGVPLDSIPMSREYLDSALRVGDPTNPRMMTTSEWKYKLKSDPAFGYQYTAQAEKEVNQVMLGLEKALGFRK